MAFLGPNNAFAWAHYRLRGGWQRTLTVTGAAVFLLVMLIVGTVESNPISRSRTLFSWTIGLFAFQGAVLVLYVMGRIGNAIRADIQSRIIEWHRLMPTPPTEAVAGYISGAAMQPLVFAAGMFVVGIFTSAAAGIDVSRWFFAHAILLAFSIFLWTVAAYASFGAKFGAAAIFIPIFFGPSLAGGGALSALPGLFVLLNPIIGDSIFDLRTTGITLPATYAMALAAQFYFGTIFFIAAARRYRSVDSVGIDTMLGLLLVAGWAAISCVGIREWEEFRPRGGWRITDVDMNVKVIASVIAGVLIALTPVSASAWGHTRWRRHQALHDPAPLRRPIPAVCVIAIATFLILLIPYVGDVPTQLGLAAMIIAIALGGVYFVCSWVYFGYPKAIIVGSIWVVITWVMPVMISLIRYGLADYGEAEPIDGIATASPIGALIVIWGNLNTDVWAGVFLQFLVMCIPLTLRLMQVWRVRSARQRGL